MIVPQVRPARTFVLIVIGELLAGSMIVSEHRHFAAEAASADLRLDLHIELLVRNWLLTRSVAAG